MAMPFVTQEPGSQDNPIYQVGSRSFVFFRNPRPDAVDPQTAEQYRDVIVFWTRSEDDKQALLQDEDLPFFTTALRRAPVGAAAGQPDRGVVTARADRDRPGGVVGPGVRQAGQGLAGGAGPGLTAAPTCSVVARGLAPPTCDGGGVGSGRSTPGRTVDLPVGARAGDRFGGGSIEGPPTEWRPVGVRGRRITLLPWDVHGRLSPEEVGSRMRHYEMMIILDPGVEERTVPNALERFLDVVRKGGGSIDKVDVWGRRRLAYDIKKKSEGVYAVVDMQATPDLAAELDRQLNLNESILRTKVIRPEVR